MGKQNHTWKLVGHSLISLRALLGWSSLGIPALQCSLGPHSHLAWVIFCVSPFFLLQTGLDHRDDLGTGSGGCGAQASSPTAARTHGPSPSLS